MKFSLRHLCLFTATLTAVAWAQTQTPAATSAPTRIPAAKRTDKTTKTGKAVIPDPDILDGSTFEAEKRPLYGMLSEIEMGEKDGGKSDKVSPNSGPAGGGAQSEQQTPDKSGGGKGAPAAPKEGQTQAEAQAQAQGGGSKSAEGPAAQAGGVQAGSLQVPEGMQAGSAGTEAGKPRDLQIGDATLQIPTAKSTPNVIGTEATNATQYEKKLPSGGQQGATTGNRGAEKGRVVPKGL